MVYWQNINNYIFLQPQNEIRLTIRGAFPVFQYQQVDAQIYGLDFSGKLQVTPALLAKLNYSFIRGKDLTNQAPLINMPSNNFQGVLAYDFPATVKLGSQTFKNMEVAVAGKVVFRQGNLLGDQDFVPPPDTYHLFSLQWSGDLQWRKTSMRLRLKADNILNATYRDYLNRQRYFADDLGFNLQVGLGFKF